MSNREHPFNPVLTESFLHSMYMPEKEGNVNSACLKIKQNKEDLILRKKFVTDSRSLFYQLNHTDEFQNSLPLAYDFLVLQLKKVEQVYSTMFIKDYEEQQLNLLKTSTLNALPEAYVTQDNLNKIIYQAASIELTQPYWLHNIFQVSTSQALCVLNLMSIFRQITKVDGYEASIIESYKALLLSTGEKTPELHHVDYSQQREICSAVFDLAAIQLALARFPRVLFPEILGFTLAYFQMPSVIDVCFPRHPFTLSFVELKQNRVNNQLAALISCIKGYLELFPPHQKKLWYRIQKGFWLYQLRMQCCRDQFNQIVHHPSSTEILVSRLLQQKAMAAIGHHKRIQLNGKCLDEWFKGMPHNCQALLQALIESNYVNKEKPDESPLLKLFDFDGPMFGVINQSERIVLQNWLNDGLNIGASENIEESENTETQFLSIKRLKKNKQYNQLTKRDLYYYLLNADLYPDILAEARSRLARVIWLTAWFNPPPFKQYSHEQFEQYIEGIYQHEIKAYQPLTGKPKISREAYVWAIEQIAPMILIDGCWLQNSLVLQNISPNISEILFKIYCDELGNGNLEQNHPYIFQQLLNGLSIQLPDLHSVDFINYPGFINSAFDLPVYMLSLASCSVEFLPELLGLNMAIELSGLGQSYLNLIDDWNYWEIDSTIAKIHVSIDNYESGHTYLARKAIQLYMDNVMLSFGDKKITNQHWNRVYSGYASLRFVGWRFKLSLPYNYLLYNYRHKKLINKV